jgi:SAM-dependent methyltransferase
MSYPLSRACKQQIDEFFADASGREYFEALARPIKPVPVLLDAGCGNGYASLKLAEYFQPQKFILADIENNLEVQLPSNVEFQRVDVCSPDFLARFQSRVTAVVCVLALHEINDIVAAVGNLIQVLPQGGVTIFIDRSQQGWRVQRERCVLQGVEAMQHVSQDIARVVRFGLDTNSGIRRFWEKGVFPRVPGETYLAFNGYVYTVLYIAKQWGQVKQPPPDIAALLRQRDHVG